MLKVRQTAQGNVRRLYVRHEHLWVDECVKLHLRISVMKNLKLFEANNYANAVRLLGFKILRLQTTYLLEDRLLRSFTILAPPTDESN